MAPTVVLLHAFPFDRHVWDGVVDAAWLVEQVSSVDTPLRGVKLTPEQALKRVKKLEQEMFKHARNLEFEQAARLRDEIGELRQLALGPGAARLAG